MKLHLLIIFLLTSSILSAQKKLVEITPDIVITRVINLEQLTKDKIYQKSLLWCAENFKDNRQAIKLSNQEAGLIVGTGSTILDLDSTKRIDPASYKFSWKIEIKDFKVKFSFTEIDYNLSLGNDYRLRESDIIPFDILFMSTKKMAVYWIKVKAAAVAELNLALDNYTVKMNKPDENW